MPAIVFAEFAFEVHAVQHVLVTRGWKHFVYASLIQMPGATMTPVGQLFTQG
jgi:hypothetical protein